MAGTEYREEPCRSALNRVKGMAFKWSLNPYTGCAHQCTFCYVHAFERRADRPADDRYGASVRVKVNVADVLRRELARNSWAGELVAIGAATDPYQPAEGRYRLTRACLEVLAEAANLLSIITRGPMIVRDLDLLTTAARRADVGVTFSIPTLDPRIWRYTEPHTAPPRQRLRALRMLTDAGIDASVGIAPPLPGLSDDPELIADTMRVGVNVPTNVEDQQDVWYKVTLKIFWYASDGSVGSTASSRFTDYSTHVAGEDGTSDLYCEGLARQWFN